MARPRTPTNILRLRGSAPKKNPGRLRERENEPVEERPLGPPPKALTPKQRQAWKELADNSVPGVLGKADRHAVEIAACLLAEVRGGEPTATIYAQLLRSLSMLGMSPADRSKVQLPAKPKHNPFADL